MNDQGLCDPTRTVCDKGDEPYGRGGGEDRVPTGRWGTGDELQWKRDS